LVTKRRINLGGLSAKKGIPSDIELIKELRSKGILFIMSLKAIVCVAMNLIVDFRRKGIKNII